MFTTTTIKRSLQSSARLFQPSNILFQAISTKMQSAIVTRTAPQWTAKAVINGTEIKSLSSSDFKDKLLVMLFYPLNFTFVCPTEVLAFNDKLEEFKKHGAEVVAISIDSPYSHYAFVNTPRNKGGVEGLKIPLVSDLTKEIAKSFDVLHDDGMAYRGLMIVDGKGILRVKHINDFPLGRNVEEALRLVEAINFADTHGEVCPANWKKGAKTMKPDLDGRKRYFESVDN